MCETAAVWNSASPSSNELLFDDDRASGINTAAVQQQIGLQIRVHKHKPTQH